MSGRNLITRSATLLAGLLLLSASGCNTLNRCDVEAIPVERLPQSVLGRSRTELQDISMMRLRQEPPEVYQLGPGDILGVYVKDVIGDKEEAPMVHFPEDGSQPPAVGIPVPVHEDGTIMLPLLKPLPVEGLTLAQASNSIRDRYTRTGVLIDGEGQFMVTLMRRRMHRIIVIREESGGVDGVTKRGTGYAIDLPAYENDLLHALTETGGFPGVDARSEVLIFRGGFRDGVERDALLAGINSCRNCNPCNNGLNLPDDENVVKIPLRFYPDQLPRFSEEDIILQTGDVVMIEARDEEKFYTGGALKAGEHLLPRDYDLDILQAIAVANGTIGASTSLGLQQGGGGGGGSGTAPVAGLPPSRAVVLRNFPGRGKVPIRIDLKRALTDDSQKLLIQPKDTIVVQYTLLEELYNTAISMVRFNYILGGGNNGGAF